VVANHPGESARTANEAADFSPQPKPMRDHSAESLAVGAVLSPTPKRCPPSKVRGGAKSLHARDNSASKDASVDASPESEGTRRRDNRSTSQIVHQILPSSPAFQPYAQMLQLRSWALMSALNTRTSGPCPKIIHHRLGNKVVNCTRRIHCAAPSGRSIRSYAPA